MVDETRLQGVFDFTLEWTPDETQKLSPDPASDVESPGPSLFAALREQLGLNLEGRRELVEILLVDHMENAPTEN